MNKTEQIDESHYKEFGEFEPWDVLSHWLSPEEYRGYQKGTAIVYLARERRKGGDNDIRKADRHLCRLIAELAQPEPVKATPLRRSTDWPTVNTAGDRLETAFQPPSIPQPAMGFVDAADETPGGDFDIWAEVTMSPGLFYRGKASCFIFTPGYPWSVIRWCRA